MQASKQSHKEGTVSFLRRLTMALFSVSILRCCMYYSRSKDNGVPFIRAILRPEKAFKGFYISFIKLKMCSSLCILNFRLMYALILMCIFECVI